MANDLVSCARLTYHPQLKAIGARSGDCVRFSRRPSSSFSSAGSELISKMLLRNKTHATWSCASCFARKTEIHLSFPDAIFLNAAVLIALGCPVESTAFHARLCQSRSGIKISSREFESKTAKSRQTIHWRVNTGEKEIECPDCWNSDRHKPDTGRRNRETASAL